MIALCAVFFGAAIGFIVYGEMMGWTDSTPWREHPYEDDVVGFPDNVDNEKE